MENFSVKITISGRVQGVGFRYYIWRFCKDRRITGFVRNLSNGNVEIFAEGDKKDLEELIEYANSGPSSAKVTSCHFQWLEYVNKYNNFEIY
jgi:acylphosphatase